MSNIIAGIGRGQLPYIEEHVALKKKIYDTYKSAFADIDAITMNPYLSYSEPNFWLSCMTIDPAKSDVKPADVMKALADENIESRPIWKPMHLQPVFAGYDFISVDGDVGGEIFEHGLCLPSDIKNTNDDMERIIGIIRNLFEGERVVSEVLQTYIGHHLRSSRNDHVLLALRNRGDYGEG